MPRRWRFRWPRGGGARWPGTMRASVCLATMQIGSGPLFSIEGRPSLRPRRGRCLVDVPAHLQHRRAVRALPTDSAWYLPAGILVLTSGGPGLFFDTWPSGAGLSQHPLISQLQALAPEAGCRSPYSFSKFNYLYKLRDPPAETSCSTKGLCAWPPTWIVWMDRSCKLLRFHHKYPIERWISH